MSDANPTRLEVVERAGKSLRLLHPLLLLCRELEKVDNLDRMTADAEARAKQSAQACDELIAAKNAEVSRLDGLIQSRKDAAEAAKVAASSAADGIVAAAETRAATLIGEANARIEAATQESAGRLDAEALEVQRLHAEAAGMVKRIEALTAEADEAEARLARAKAAAAAVLEG